MYIHVYIQEREREGLYSILPNIIVWATNNSVHCLPF